MIDSPCATRFIGARHFREHADPRDISWCVLHSTEGGTAFSVAMMFAGPKSPVASCTYVVDGKETIQCVREHDVPFCAPGANALGIHIEMAGWSAWTWNRWLLSAVPQQAAKLAADVVHRHGLPLIFVDAEGLLRGDKGVTTHHECTKAAKLAAARHLTGSSFYGVNASHVDPGAGFNMEAFLRLVADELPEIDCGDPYA